MNKAYITVIAVILAFNTGCINCVNQSVHGNGSATVIKSDSKAVVVPKKTAVILSLIHI